MFRFESFGELLFKDFTLFAGGISVVCLVISNFRFHLWSLGILARVDAGDCADYPRKPSQSQSVGVGGFLDGAGAVGYGEAHYYSLISNGLSAGIPTDKLVRNARRGLGKK